VACEDESGRPFEASRGAQGLFVRTPFLAHGVVDGTGELKPLAPRDAFDMRDVAAVDGDGDYFIVARADDQINLRGYKMYPREIEDVVRLAPGVVDCCAFATESAGAGRLHVAIETSSAVDLEVVRALCAKMLPPYKRPSVLVTTRRLPRNRVGKVVRREVAAELGESHTQAHSTASGA
jgi:long-chain acyl-CoA synthetase